VLGYLPLPLIAAASATAVAAAAPCSFTTSITSPSSRSRDPCRERTRSNLFGSALFLYLHLYWVNHYPCLLYTQLHPYPHCVDNLVKVASLIIYLYQCPVRIPAWDLDVTNAM
jgi:hypothetical protein